MNYSIILTGATGMVGEGVLLECLDNPAVASVLSISRKPTGRNHPKLKEYIVPDFLELKENSQQLKGYDACFFCAGISSVGMKEADYHRITFTTTLHFATRVLEQNPQMTFLYISGAGTDSSEQGRIMWARVKGKTENALAALPFKKVFLLRPGIMKITAGQKNIPGFYKYLGWLFPFFKLVMPGGTSTLQQLARAMINCLGIGNAPRVLEVRDINRLGSQ